MMFNKKELMTRPEYFNVIYSINEWMNPKVGGVNKKLALKQWTDLHHLLIRLGCYIEYSDYTPKLPDICFTANAGLFHKDKVVLAKFKHEERKGEEKYYKKAFEDLGYELYEPNFDFEGAGDAFIVQDILFLGTGYRSNKAVSNEIMKFLGLNQLVYCNLVDPHFYHLDTCFCPLNDNTAMFYPAAFDFNTLRIFDQLKDQIKFLEVNKEEAFKFACNSVVVTIDDGYAVIIPAGCPNTKKMLNKEFFKNIFELPMDQFMLAGGACKCLTLMLGEHKNNF